MRRDEGKTWMDKAEHDLSAGHLMLKNNGYTDTACFFAHQTVEKALKGFLTLHDTKPDRTHNLVALSNEATKIDQTVSDFESEFVVLNAYYIPSRYPRSTYRILI